MVQVGARRNRVIGEQAFATALVVAALMALAAVGGYEVGSSRADSHALVVQHSAVQSSPTSTAAEAPPITGFQP